jgi:hypothetical protein
MPICGWEWFFFFDFFLIFLHIQQGLRMAVAGWLEWLAGMDSFTP